MLAGDFHRHHPLWDKGKNHHLFTSTNLQEAQHIIDLQVQFNLVQALPRGTPTLVASNTGNYMRPANVFVSDTLTGCVVSCTALPEHRPAKTDHCPILTTLDTMAQRAKPQTCRNYKKVDWNEFRKTLKGRLSSLPAPQEIGSTEELQRRLSRLCKAINDAVDKHIPETRPCPRTKRWWLDECAMARRALNRLGAKAHRKRFEMEHPIHVEFR